METGCKPTTRKGLHSALVLLALVAAAALVTSTAQANGGTSDRRQAPSAMGFAGLIADSTSAYQKTHGISARLTNVNCVRASSFEYMCSYAVTSPNRPRTCHLLQARWTPNTAALYTATLAGRVKECGTLREALRSLP